MRQDAQYASQIQHRLKVISPQSPTDVMQMPQNDRESCEVRALRVSCRTCQARDSANHGLRVETLRGRLYTDHLLCQVDTSLFLPSLDVVHLSINTMGRRKIEILPIQVRTWSCHWCHC